MKILVTGANGYLGQGIVTSILTMVMRLLQQELKLIMLMIERKKLIVIFFQLRIHMNFLENQIYYCIWHGEMGSYTIQIHT